VAEAVKPGDDSVEPREVVVDVCVRQQSRRYRDMQASDGLSSRAHGVESPVVAVG
jgi:hypothetical protein